MILAVFGAKFRPLRAEFNAAYRYLRIVLSHARNNLCALRVGDAANGAAAHVINRLARRSAVRPRRAVHSRPFEPSRMAHDVV